MNHEVVDLTLDDVDKDDTADECILLSDEDETQTLEPQGSEKDFDGFNPSSPADSVDSRDELYSLVDLVDPPNLNDVIHSETAADSLSKHSEAEYDSDVIEVEPEYLSSQPSLEFRRSYPCSFCSFTTDVEEFLHNHIVIHAPGTRPHKRVYCPDCSYSTGSLKFLYFHMLKIHDIDQPLFYRIGEKRYRCHYCQASTDLRVDIEAHARKHETDPKKLPRQLRFRYQCVVLKCRFSSEEIEDVSYHIKKSHNIANPICYRERHSLLYVYHCFKCSHVTPYLKCMNKHALKHYSKYQLMQPYKYFCPSCKFSSRKEYRMVRHLKLKHSSRRNYYKLDSMSFKCFSCGIRKNNASDMVNHCLKHRKKKRRASCP